MLVLVPRGVLGPRNALDVPAADDDAALSAGEDGEAPSLRNRRSTAAVDDHSAREGTETEKVEGGVRHRETTPEPHTTHSTHPCTTTHAGTHRRQGVGARSSAVPR